MCVLLVLVVASGSGKAFLLSTRGSRLVHSAASGRVVASSFGATTWDPLQRTRVSMLTQKQGSNIMAMEEDDEDEDNDEEQPETSQSSEDSVSVLEVSEEPKISLLKEGIKFPTKLDGSDVRVGIIMCRWNADVIQGLYKVSY